MKAFIISLFLTLSTLAMARNLVPNSNGQGQVGDTNAYWESLYVGSLFLNGANVDSLIPTNEGVTTINNLKGNVTISAGPGFITSNSGSKVYINLFTNNFAVGTNIATYRYTGGDQYFQVPATVTNMRAWLWGGAGGGGAGYGGPGGYTEVTFPVLPFEILTIVVGGAGARVSGTTNIIGVTDRTYPDGGRGVSANSLFAGAGGGRSQILRGSLSITNLGRTVAVAGGGGGGTDASRTGGQGGGDTGVDGGTSSAGSGFGGGRARSIYTISSTNTIVYLTDSVTTTAFVYNITFNGATGGTSQAIVGVLPRWTNQPGNLFFGGDAGIVYSNNAGYAGGGGGGWYGGGGALSFTGGVNAAGGSGIGWINTNLGAYGRTIRGVAATPAGTENTYYISGSAVGVANASTGNGLIILQY